MKINEETWRFIQTHLDYSDEDMKLFRKNPRNEDVLLKTPDVLNKTIIIEVVESHGCNSQHKVGDKFYFDGAGNLLSKLCPKKICMGALGSVKLLVLAVPELIYAGVDPNVLRFNKTGCSDVGLHYGGWGHIIMQMRIEDRNNLKL